MKVSIRFLALLLLLAMLPFSAPAETVVTSFYPIWLIALNLADGLPDLTVRNLAAPDTGCLHDYQLQTGDMKTLAEADLFLVNGAGMESYLDLVYSAFPDLPVADASRGIPLLKDLGTLEIGASEEEEEENAHIWLNAANASLMARNLADAMMASFPAWSDQIRKNLDSWCLRMEVLDAELKAGLKDLPRRGIITFHEAFPYFAEAYGLKVLAVVCREPGETLTPSQLAELADAVVSLDLPPLFVEPQAEELTARVLAAETGARVFSLDPIVTGPAENVPLDYYDSVMRQNMRVLQEALNP